MRAGIIFLLLSGLIVAWLTQVACADVSAPINIGIPFVVGPGFTLAAPFSQGAYLINAFNTSTLACTDTESLAISLVPAGTGAVCGGLSISPAIAQSSAQTMLLDRSYFFNDFITAA
jgi:hypothetical protein